ncbi:hypothetical protein L2E82_37602 [Cichorium intybus]|uniref:Uncharacterized protein n=1 Tax=Cichorium intybus TaxID=13427 RepID=A0ACB9AF12_CICIN|nr:hypothetical protein L2E82_37602 [Cichorium intybus]
MKTPYEILYGRIPNFSHFRSFGFPCTPLHLEATPKFNSKPDDCYFVGYASKTEYRVYKKMTKQIVESYDVCWLEENETDARVGPDLLFNYADLFKPFYVHSSDVLGTQLGSSGVNRDDDAFIIPDLIKPSVILEDPALNDGVSPASTIIAEDAPTDSSQVVGKTPVVDQFASHEDVFNSDPPDHFDSTLMDSFFPERISDEYVASTSHDFRDSDRGASGSGSVENITYLPVSTASLEHAVPSRIQRDHLIHNVIGSLDEGVQTRSQSGPVNECLYSGVISQIESKNVQMALNEPSWVDAMHEELNQFEKLNVWKLVELPEDKKSFDTRWVFRNNQDDSGVIVRNKARLVVRRFRQIEGLGYTEVYAPVARLEAIRIFLAYVSYMNFIFYQMDVKTAFLYGEVKEEIYVDQPPGFINSKFLNHAYRLDKALNGLHQAPSACEALCHKFEHVIKKQFEMSSLGEMTMFIGLQVKQSSTGILLHQGKYVENILEKFEFKDAKAANTPMSERPLLSSDPDGEPVDQTYYHSNYGGCDIDRKSTSAGCQFLGDRLISWQCKKQQTVPTSTIEAEYVAALACCSEVIWMQHQLLDYNKNVADLFTKPFAKGRFDVLVAMLNMIRFTLKSFLSKLHVKDVTHYYRDSLRQSLPTDNAPSNITHCRATGEALKVRFLQEIMKLKQELGTIVGMGDFQAIKLENRSSWSADQLSRRDQHGPRDSKGMTFAPRPAWPSRLEEPGLRDSTIGYGINGCGARKSKKQPDSNAASIQTDKPYMVRPYGYDIRYDYSLSFIAHDFVTVPAG